MKNYIKNDINNFYISNESKSKPLLLPSKETHSTTKISAELTGSFDDKKICLKTGYKEDSKYDNVFILSIDDLNKMINYLHTVKESWNNHDDKVRSFNAIRDELQRYINMGYIKSLTLTLTSLPSGFEPTLYKAFEVKPTFIHDLDPEAGVNLGFRYIHVLHLDIDETKYNTTLNELRFGHTEVPIKFVGYDRAKEVDRYIQRAKKELANYDPAKAAKNRAKYAKDLQQMGIPINVLNLNKK